MALGPKASGEMLTIAAVLEAELADEADADADANAADDDDADDDDADDDAIEAPRAPRAGVDAPEVASEAGSAAFALSMSYIVAAIAIALVTFCFAFFFA